MGRKVYSDLTQTRDLDADTCGSQAGYTCLKPSTGFVGGQQPAFLETLVEC